MLNVIVSEPEFVLASLIAWRKLPAPESSVLVTMIGAFAKAAVVVMPSNSAKELAMTIVEAVLRLCVAEPIITLPRTRRWSCKAPAGVRKR
jgi:hypothetical protein